MNSWERRSPPIAGRSKAVKQERAAGNPEEAKGIRVVPTSRTVDNHVAGLLGKPGRYSSQPGHIKTVHGVGYQGLFPELHS